MAGVGSDRRRWRLAVVGGSVAAHLLVLFVLGTVLPPLRRPPPEPPAIELKLILPVTRHRPAPAPPRVAAAPSSPQSGAMVHQAPAPHATPPSPVAAGAPAATPGPAAAGGAIHFFEVPGCAREDLMLMTPEERIRCHPPVQSADGTGGRAIPRGGPAISGIDPAKRSAWDQQVAEKEKRRDGTEAQGRLRALQDARGKLAPSRTFDINAGFNCKLAFGANAKPGLGGLKCEAAPPPPPQAH